MKKKDPMQGAQEKPQSFAGRAMKERFETDIQQHQEDRLMDIDTREAKRAQKKQVASRPPTRVPVECMVE